MGSVTETIETNGTIDTTTIPAADRGPHRLYRALAWVGIAAGSLFIVATVFFSGFVIGRHALLIPHPPMGPGGPMGPDSGPRTDRLTPPSPQPTTPSRP